MKLEVMVLPVADVDKAKDFYQGLGWRLDAEVSVGDVYRLLQLTPPGSNTSIIFVGGHVRPAGLDRRPGPGGGRHRGGARRAPLAGRRCDRGVPRLRRGLGGGFIADPTRRAPGADPEGRSYASYESFSDPDGNGRLLQEITTRLPGRV